MSLFASLARSLFGLSLSRKIPTELCEHSHAKWHRPEGQNATNIFRLREKKRLVYFKIFFLHHCELSHGFMVIILI